MAELEAKGVGDWLRTMGRIEGVSFLVLILVAMPIKYIMGNPKVVTVVGAAHGFLWIAYLLVLAVAWRSMKWRFSTVFMGGLASVLPLGPWWFESWLGRQASEASI